MNVLGIVLHFFAFLYFYWSFNDSYFFAYLANKFIIRFVNTCITSKPCIIKYSKMSMSYGRFKVAIVKIKIQQCYSCKIFKIVHLDMLAR